MDIAVTKAGTLVEDPECLEFRDDTRTLLGELDPDAVVISNSNNYERAIILDTPSYSPTPRIEAWADAYRAQLQELRSRGFRVGAVVDTPGLPFDAVDCVSERGDAGRCTTTVADTLDPKRAFMDAEAAVEQAFGDVPVLDVNDQLCPGGTCPVVVDGVFVYADEDHLNAAYARQLTPQVEAFLRELMG